MSRRVLIVVTHLLGAGHLTRAAALGRAFARGGHATTLVSGGMPTNINSGGVDFVQLPPVHIHGTAFSSLLDEAGQPVTPARLKSRADLLLETLRRMQPDILITELFPFGRRVLAEEFLTVLSEARTLDPRPLILASIRDILVTPTKAERVAQTVDRICDLYDAVLVHSDPDLIPLETTWPVDDRLRPFIRHTGYVDENPQPVMPSPREGIVVSGGSSAASLPLYRAAIGAARQITDRRWTMLVGRGVPDHEFQALRESAPSHMRVERARPDFRVLLAGAELSVSQTGYNTCVDLLRSGVRAVLVPFEAGDETEQSLRARRLEERGTGVVVTEANLTPDALATAVHKVFALPPPRPNAVALDGAERSVAMVEKMFVGRPAIKLATADWSAIEEALDRAEGDGRALSFWWRDDDAVAETPQLHRLLDLSSAVSAHLALAVIPGKLERSLVDRLQGAADVSVLVHGAGHTNHGPASSKAEFGPHRPLVPMAQEIAAGLETLSSAFGERCLPVFVPPWNRIAPDLVPALPGIGYRGLSTYRDRRTAEAAPGLSQVNTHIDPIHWHGTRSLRDVNRLIAELAATIRRRSDGLTDEPIGLLTHHLVHDDAVWSFCENFAYVLDRRRLHFQPASRLFCENTRNDHKT